MRQTRTTLIQPEKQRAYDPPLVRWLRAPTAKPPSPVALAETFAPEPTELELESLVVAAQRTLLAPRYAGGPRIVLILLAMGLAVSYPGYALHAADSPAPVKPASAPAADAGASGGVIKAKGIAPVRRRVAHPNDPKDQAELVERAILAAKVAIYRVQKNGNWEQSAFPDPNGNPSAVAGGQFGGTTAMAVYALLVAGEDATKEPLLSAVRWLKKAEITGTYALGFRAQIWPLLSSTAPGNNDLKTMARRDAQLLAARVKTQGPALGFFDYAVSGPNGRYDHSVSQYGVLGMSGIARTDYIEIPQNFWSVIQAAWVRDQSPATGGWKYDEGRATEAKASVTAGGVATLLLTQEFLHSAQGAACAGNFNNPPLDAGLKWLDDHFDLIQDNYTWYDIERIGVDGGYKYFGTNDWFKVGSEKLVRSQTKTGEWAGGHGAIPNTCFALLFLARGREPVAVNKLQYASGIAGSTKLGNWNQRSSDVANFSRWLGGQTCTSYNWQSVDLTGASDELHDAPLLYVAGNQAVHFSDDEEGKLREFLDDGGLMVFNADCGAGGRPFADSIMGARGLSKRLGYDYEWRKLPADHPIYQQQTWPRAQWKGAKPDVYAMSNGARELMILFATDDPARYWQARTIGGHEWAYELMGDIFFYATDKAPRPFKAPTSIVRPRPEIKGDKVLKIARLQYSQNWNPEPGGWRRMVAILHNDYKLDLKVTPVKLGDGKLAAGGYKLAHLTGTTKYHLSDAEKNDLKAYIAGGGTLVVDACGGSADFSDAVLTDLRAVLGAEADQLKQPIQVDNPVFTVPGGSFEEFAYRVFARKLLGNAQLHAPRLRVALHDQRPVCYFSPEDLSVGMVGHEVDGIYGYTPAVSTAVMRNIILSVDAAP